MAEPSDEIMRKAHVTLNKLAVIDVEKFDDRRGVVARALMEAEARGREQEREECAKVAEERADRYAHFANKHEGSPIGDSNTMRCGAAMAIATAIRKRGES